MPGLFAGTVHAARAPRVLLRGLRLLKRKHARDAPVLKSCTDRTGRGWAGSVPAHAPRKEARAAANVYFVALGPFSVTEQGSFQETVLLQGFFKPGCHHLGDPPSASPR